MAKLDLDDLDALLGAVSNPPAKQQPKQHKSTPAQVPAVVDVPQGIPLEIDLVKIIPDPNQVRKYFDETTLNELAESIRQHGINTPVSVKPADANGLYMLNFGERRWRAAAIAGLRTIPAFVNKTHDVYVQAVENLQRDGFKPMELAQFVGTRIAAGDKQKTIAEKLGKSKAWVSKIAGLLDLLPLIADAANSEKFTSYDALFDLNSHLKSNPDAEPAIAEFLGSDEKTSLNQVRTFISELKGATKKVSVPKLSETPKDPPTAEGQLPLTGTDDDVKEGEGANTGNDTDLVPPETVHHEEVQTRTSTEEELDTDAQQHAADQLYREAHRNEDSSGTTKGAQESLPPAMDEKRGDPMVDENERLGGPKRDGNNDTNGNSFNEGKSENKITSPDNTDETMITNPVLMIRVGNRGGTLNLNKGTLSGLIGWVTFDGENKETPIALDEITLSMLISQ